MRHHRRNLGAITSGRRNLRSGAQFNHYFQAPEKDDRIIIKDGEVTDTVELMKKVVWKYLADTEQIAQRLKSPSVKETGKNIWDFLYHHIQYKLDQDGLEQLRRPSRSWFDRKSGIDCDCFAIFSSSILTNLQIPHSFRITKYDGNDYFQHVYVVIPYAGSYLIIDPVLSSFNFEEPYSTKLDIHMNLNGIDVAVLSGVPGMTDHYEDPFFKYLLETRAAAHDNPQAYSAEFTQSLDIAIEYWNTSERQHALDMLARKELNGTLGTLSGENDFFNSLKKVGRGAKNASRALLKYNPVSVLARTGFMLALKLNLRGMRKKLLWGYASLSQAKQAGIDANTHQRTQSALEKVKHIWTKTLLGKKETLKNIIVHGSDSSIGQLGAEPVTTAAAITAATPVIVAVLKILKDAGLLSKQEDTSEYSIRDEMNRKAVASSDIESNMTPSGAGTFIKNNSTLLLVGAGVAVVGGYFLLKKKTPSHSLSGGPCLQGTCAKGANPNRSKRTTKKTSAVAKKRTTTPTTTKPTIKKVVLS
jgi:hypothetical protein